MSFKIKSNSTDEEVNNKKLFVKYLKDSPIPENELLSNLFLYMPRQDLNHLLLVNYMYQKILNTHGIIIEFGCRWGRNMAIFESLRGIYESFNYNRKVVGFDTFQGFLSINEKDRNVEIGDYGVTEDYEKQLKILLETHEKMSPIPNMEKFELCKGEASIEIKRYLDKHPETIVALAWFDMDIYKPTKNCLEAIKPYLTKGSILFFDELNDRDFPGETLALKEVFGLDKFKIQRTPFSSLQAYIEIE
jgi:hypothetical protein